MLTGDALPPAIITRIVVELFDSKATALCLIETANRHFRRHLFVVGSTRHDNANSSPRVMRFIGCNCGPFYVIRNYKVYQRDYHYNCRHPS